MVSLSWIRISVLDSEVAIALVSDFPDERGAETTFSSFENEGNTFPSCVFYVCYAGAEGRTLGVLGYGVVIFIAWLLTVFRLGVLANDGVLHLERWDKSKYACLQKISFGIGV